MLLIQVEVKYSSSVMIYRKCRTTTVFESTYQIELNNGSLIIPRKTLNCLLQLVLSLKIEMQAIIHVNCIDILLSSRNSPSCISSLSSSIHSANNNESFNKFIISPIRVWLVLKCCYLAYNLQIHSKILASCKDQTELSFQWPLSRRLRYEEHPWYTP